MGHVASSYYWVLYPDNLSIIQTNTWYQHPYILIVKSLEITWRPNYCNQFENQATETHKMKWTVPNLNLSCIDFKRIGYQFTRPGWEIFGTHQNRAVSYIAYTKFHLPRPVIHSPSQIFACIGERPGASFPACRPVQFMMTSSNGNIFRVTGPLCGEFTGHRWIPRIKASDAELWCFLWSVPE